MALNRIHLGLFNTVVIMKYILCVILMGAFCCGCIDPYPTIKWYNATQNDIVLIDGKVSNVIKADTYIDQIPGDYKNPYVLVTGGLKLTYPKRLPRPSDKYASFKFFGNKLQYTFQLLPDGRILALPNDNVLPAKATVVQPEGFPLLPISTHPNDH
jgi:hypothetical protein